MKIYACTTKEETPHVHEGVGYRYFIGITDNGNFRLTTSDGENTTIRKEEITTLIQGLIDANDYVEEVDRVRAGLIFKTKQLEELENRKPLTVKDQAID